MGKLSAVTARILRYHEGRAPDMLERKYAAMAASPFAFYRGSCQLFVDAWPARSALNDAPAVWSCGDLHFENLGCYKGDNRLAYFDLNDFDEAALLPVSWDITRFAASVLVGAPALRVGSGAASTLADLYLDAFGEALAHGKARWVERETATGMTRELLDAVRERKRKTLLNERTLNEGGLRSIRVDGVKALAASHDEAAQVKRVVERLGSKLGRKKFYRVIDVARRIAGCGSLGLARFIVLVEGKGSPRGNFLLDLKEARTPASAGHSPFAQPRWKSDADRIVAVQSRVQAVSPALLSSLRMDGAGFVLRELQPLQDRMRMEAWGGDVGNLRDAMMKMGQVTAWASLRASGRQNSAIADDLIAFAKEPGWRRAVLSMARRVAARTMAEWRDFRADAAAGRPKTEDRRPKTEDRRPKTEDRGLTSSV
ncbi:MAG: DUF2252 domain-containing protein [Gemmatimonadales bacterium]